MEFCYRVTKYDPANRNQVGHYIGEEWTSVHDIGAKYEARIFTVEDYLEAEEAYVQAIRSFMREAEIPYLTVASLDKWTRFLKKGKLRSHYPKAVRKLFSRVKEGDLLNPDQIESMERLILRQNLWCKLEYGDQFFVHFGYEYYMYIGTSRMCGLDVLKHDNVNLYIEPYLSPYLD